MIWRCLVLSCAIIALPASAFTAPVYPQVIKEIPEAFWGRWDEIVDDGCFERESQITLEARTAFSFEIAYDVTSVRLMTPQSVEIGLRVLPESDADGPSEETWQMVLIDDQTLSGPDRKPPFMKRCPADPEAAK